MYSPPYNRVENRTELLAFLQSNSFPILVTGTGGVLHASHLPVTVHEQGEQIVIDMHMAKNNPQWKEFFDDEVLVIFAGPHAYVSPRWYADQERVPTWNYAAVHAYGVPTVISERKAKAESQRRLIESLDHPIPPGPHRPIGVPLIPVGIGITGGVEPLPGHAFAKGRGTEETVQELIVAAQ